MKRVRIEDTGRGADVIIYPIAAGRQDPRERGAARSCTSELRQKINDRNSMQKFRRVLLCNFSPGDWVVTLTYSDDSLPKRPEEAVKRLKRFFKDLRKELQSRKSEFRYVYVTEGLHGDTRLHHHLVIPNLQGILDLIRQLWSRNGDGIGYDKLASRGYDAWARYLTKEPRKTGRRNVGDRMWTPSLGLKKPETIIYDVDDDYEFPLPPGVFVDRNETYQTEWFRCQYISWLQLSAEPPQKNQIFPL